MSEQEKFCSFCGSQISPLAQTCHMCGAPVDMPVESTAATQSPAEFNEIAGMSEPTPPHVEAAPNPQAKTQPVIEPVPAPKMPQPVYDAAAPVTKKKKSTPVWLIVFLALLALCLVATCIVAVLGGAVFNLVSRSEAPSEVFELPQTPPAVTQEWIPEIPATELPIPTTLPIPTEGVEITETPRFVGKDIYANGIHFTLNPELAQDAGSEIIPGVSDTSNLPEWEWTPEYTKISLSGYAATGETFHQPQILVIPAADYANLSPAAAGIIDNLRVLLQTRPVELSSQESLPFLPIWNAAQMLQSNIQYLDFQNGSGVRFLTQYGQDAYPVHSGALFYTFQGLTSDGRFYVAAILPTGNPALPDPAGVNMDQAFYDNFQQYIQDSEAQLNALPAESFIPDLNTLDKLIQSIVID